MPLFAPFVSHTCSFLHGDACDAVSYRALLSHDNQTPVNLLLTDPPYCLLTPRSSSSGSSHSRRGATSRKKLLWDATAAVSDLRFASPRAYREFTSSWLRPLVPHLAEDAVLVIWTNFLGKQPIEEAVRAIVPGATLYSEYLWIKPNKPMTERPPVQHTIQTTEEVHASMSAPVFDGPLPPLPGLSLTSSEVSFRCYEVALVFGRGSLESSRFSQSHLPQSVVCPYEDASSSVTSAHPNAKPGRVLLPLIETYSRVGDLVLDPFAGSAAHASTAMHAGRRIATMEKNDIWARSMRERLARDMETRRAQLQATATP